MGNAKRDANRVTVAMGVSTDGVTPLPFKVDSSTGYLLLHVQDSTTDGNITAVSIAKRDQNHVPVALGIDSTARTTPQALRTHNGYLAVENI